MTPGVSPEAEALPVGCDFQNSPSKASWTLTWGSYVTALGLQNPHLKDKDGKSARTDVGIKGELRPFSVPGQICRQGI